jgi:uncharacterized membrane protein required for colicin V production
MVSLSVFVWVFIGLFAIIGYARGIKRELLVASAIILALYTITILETFVKPIKIAASMSVSGEIFWMRILLFLFLIIIGYQVPNIPQAATNSRFIKTGSQDGILGALMGALNGFLIVGTIWFYIDKAGYPSFLPVIAPDQNTEIGKIAQYYIGILPPNWLGAPYVYFVVAASLAFLLIVFV